MKEEQSLFLYERKEISQLKAWFLAARPKTLSASFAPLIAGTSLAYYQVERIDFILAFFALLVSLCIQIGTNLINDALDFKKGSDTKLRIGPQRITQAGYLSFKTVLMGGFFCFALAFLCAIPLILERGWPIVLVLIASFACGYLYTGGPYPLAYVGLGEVFSFMFFGFVLTGVVYYIQTGWMDETALLAGLQMGFLNTVLLAINNFRDIEEDSMTQKRTLAVRLGALFARQEITFLSLFPYLVGFAWLFLGYPGASLLPFATLPLSIQNVQAVWRTEPNSQFNSFLARAALIQVLFGLCLSIGFIW